MLPPVFSLLSDPDSLIMAMLRPRVLTLPSHIQGTYIHNLLKVYAVSLAAAEEDEDRDRAATLTRALVEKMPAFVQSSYLEVQERVCLFFVFACFVWGGVYATVWE